MNRRGPDPSAASRGGVGVLVSWLVLFGSVQAGLALPGREVLESALVGGELDYGRVEGTVAPLTDAFVAQALGLPPPAPDEASVVEVATPAGGHAVDLASGPGPVEPGVPAGTRVVVSHPPDNDDFAEAYEVPSVPFTARTDAGRASRQPGEPGSCAPAGPTLWYRYTAERSVGLAAGTAGSARATSIAVFEGTSLGGLRPIGCHTDLSGNALVRFPATQGTRYHFQVGAPTGGGTTAFHLDLIGTTERVSVTATGDEATGGFTGASLSADGRYVAFESDSPDLVSGDDNGAVDVFVKDRATGAVERVSVLSEGSQSEGSPTGYNATALSDDGRYVAFFSRAGDLVPDDTNDWLDAFVHDRATGETTRVSVASDGSEGRRPAATTGGPAWHGWCELTNCGLNWSLDVSGDGRVVVFQSYLEHLVEDQPEEILPPYPKGGLLHVFAHDRSSGRTQLVSASSDGEAGNDGSEFASVSGEGRYVAFSSWADNLVEGDRNLVEDVFVRDLHTGRIDRVSVSPGGREADETSFMSDISEDGRYVAFSSFATNLVDRDTNGIADVFIADRVTGRIERVSVSSTGEQQVVSQSPERRTGELYRPAVRMSGDGRMVAFDSNALNLATEQPRGPNDCPNDRDTDVFVRDRLVGTTLLVSVSSTGDQANLCARVSGISRRGLEVVFRSSADNLIEDDSNASPTPMAPMFSGEDLFVHSLGGGS